MMYEPDLIINGKRYTQPYTNTDADTALRFAQIRKLAGNDTIVLNASFNVEKSNGPYTVNIGNSAGFIINNIFSLPSGYVLNLKNNTRDR